MFYFRCVAHIVIAKEERGSSAGIQRARTFDVQRDQETSRKRGRPNPRNRERKRSRGIRLHALSSGTETTIIPEEKKANAEENISTESRAGAHAGDAETSEDGLQNRYKPKSHAESLGTMVPKFMRSESEAALANLVTKYGSVDEFVKRELGYSTLDEMYKGLAAEQIDGVALAIDNIKNGDSIVIGDQTGIGKGRQAAWTRRRDTVGL